MFKIYHLFVPQCISQCSECIYSSRSTIWFPKESNYRNTISHVLEARPELAGLQSIMVTCQVWQWETYWLWSPWKLEGLAEGGVLQQTNAICRRAGKLWVILHERPREQINELDMGAWHLFDYSNHIVVPVYTFSTTSWNNNKLFHPSSNLFIYLS